MAKVGAAYPAVELDDGFLGKDGKKVNMAEYLKGKKAIVVGLPGGACCVCGTPVLGLCGPGMRGELTPPSPSPRDDAHDARAHPAFTCVPSGLEGGCGRTKRRRGCSRTPHAQHTRQAHLIVRAGPRAPPRRAPFPC